LAVAIRQANQNRKAAPHYCRARRISGFSSTNWPSP
jgi:hypothetical protein